MESMAKRSHLNSTEAHAASQWDWGKFTSDIDGAVSMMDMDGLCERHGHFLLIETKLPGQSIKIGQWRTLVTLSRKPEWTVFVVWGHKDRPEYAMRLRDKLEIKKLDDDYLRVIISAWHRRASRLSGAGYVEEFPCDMLRKWTRPSTTS
jgi:hypothetical protein